MPSTSSVAGHAMSSVSVAARKGKAPQKEKGSSGRDLFSDVDKPFMPHAIPSWTTALANVDKTRLQKATLGYAFPDPNMIAGSSNCSKYIVNWLACRAACIWRFTNEHCNLFEQAKSQDWRDFLSRSIERQLDDNGDPLPVTSESTQAQVRKRKAAEFFSAVFPLKEKPETVFWHDHAILAGDPTRMQEDLTLEVTTEILWDLFEHNFRFELLALDRMIHTLEWGSSPAYIVRDNLLRGVFFDEDGDSDGAYVVSGIPDENYGLAANDWRKRHGFVETLRQVMLTWPRSHLLPQDVLSKDYDSFLREEISVATFYCQTFYDVFGRAAVIPHRLYLLSSSTSHSAIVPSS
jgi:hypothetical protein